MTKLRFASALFGLAVLAGCADTPTGATTGAETPASVASFNRKPTTKATPIAVGELLYHDKNLSRLRNQACASCHTAEWGFFAPSDGSIRSIANSFFEGSMPGRHGDRKPPTAAYASYAPTLHWDDEDGTYRGGSFWDGRATGGRGITVIGMQALGPFKSDVEHAFSPICVLWEVSKSSYASTFDAISPLTVSSIPFGKAEEFYGKPMEAVCHDPDPSYEVPVTTPGNFTKQESDNLARLYVQVGESIGAFEHSPLVNRFSSRYDSRSLTSTELTGEGLFFGKAGCDHCHQGGGDGLPELFTDYSYYNIGVPRNPLNPAGADWKDPGIGGFLAQGFDRARAAQMMGFFKSPTVRNVDKRVGGGARTYMHNGVLTSLEQVVHFYNTRDVKSCAKLGIPEATSVLPTGPKDKRKNACWPTPDFPETMVKGLGGQGDLGDLRLSASEEAALVAYMKALSDR